jgi:hypothetical protein
MLERCFEKFWIFCTMITGSKKIKLIILLIHLKQKCVVPRKCVQHLIVPKDFFKKKNLIFPAK